MEEAQLAGEPAAEEDRAELAPDALSQRLVVLISHERSGSHFLADTLKSSSELASVDEVCNFRAVDPYKSPTSFFRFRHERQVENLDFAYRLDNETQAQFLDAYFSHLLRRVKTKKVFVDIKYGHVHNFELGWWPSEQRPFLATYLARRNVRIVHLARRDSIAAIVSSFVAENTKVWHRKSGDDDASPKKLHVPSQKIVHDALALEREKDNFFDWLADTRCFQLAYEEFCGDAALRAVTLRGLCNFLGLLGEPASLVSSYQKVTPPLRDIVENYDELRRVAALFGRGRFSRGVA